jgi:hypothetical protein
MSTGPGAVLADLRDQVGKASTKTTSCTGQTGDDIIKPAPAKATTSDDTPKIDKCGWSTRAVHKYLSRPPRNS